MPFKNRCAIGICNGKQQQQQLLRLLLLLLLSIFFRPRGNIGKRGVVAVCVEICGSEKEKEEDEDEDETKNDFLKKNFFF